MLNRKVVGAIQKVMNCMLVLTIMLCGHVVASADSTGAPAKVAILPFNMHTPSNLAYLQEGIRDMLASRLGWQGKVQILEKSVTEQAMKGIKGDISTEDASRIGKALRVDYVLYGSVTGLGQSISIDARMTATSGATAPVAFSAQAKTLDDVIPQIDRCAQDINSKIFNRASETDRAAASESEAAATRNPELLLPAGMLPSEKASDLNPNFIELTPEGSLRQGGVWKSQTIVGAIVGMDIGDMNGDGRLEVVTVMKDKITVYRKEGSALKTIATHPGSKVDNFIWVSVCDVAHDGRALIFVNNLKKQNTTGAPSTELSYGNRGFTEMLICMVFSLQGGKLQQIAKLDDYFVNAVEFPKKGKLLIGQRKGEVNVGAFVGGIYEMALRGGSLAPTVAVPLPDRCNVFNCIRSDINGDHSEETILIDKTNRLLILNPGGDQTWVSDKIFAATTNAFEGKVNDRRYNEIDYYSIPSPVIVTDLNKDDIPEIIVNRNPNSLAKFLPESMKTFDKGEIVSFSWDQLGMVENWKTREIQGMVTSLRLADLDHKGVNQLVVGMVAAKDLLKLGDAKSTVFSYDLNVPAKKTAEKAAEKRE